VSDESTRGFEDLRRELEQIVGTLERGEVAVDEAIELWRRGEELHRRCAALLDAAEGRIEELQGGAPEPDDIRPVGL
jgi:exodeoxyribonuclease VII small subunit